MLRQKPLGLRDELIRQDVYCGVPDLGCDFLPLALQRYDIDRSSKRLARKRQRTNSVAPRQRFDDGERRQNRPTRPDGNHAQHAFGCVEMVTMLRDQAPLRQLAAETGMQGRIASEADKIEILAQVL